MNPLTAPGETVNILESLRNNTRNEHSQLEALPISKSIVSEEVTLAQYALYLQLMYPIVLQIEKSVYPLLRNIIPDLDLRYKADMIVNDLIAIEAQVPENITVLELPKPMDMGFALGIVYVIEGSTLGGRYILNNISKQLDLSPAHGASYFAGYQNATGSRWKDFLGTLAQSAFDENQDAIIEGARFAFQSIYDHLKND